MSLRGLFHLGVIYIAWGSTYLAIRIAVREGTGFPPLTMSATRVFVASLILFALAALFQKTRIIPKRKELAVVVASGLFLWLGGHGFVAIAETKVHSAYTAVIIGATPLLVAIMESLIDRRKPSITLLGFLFIGIGGVAVLNGPALTSGNLGDLWVAGILIIACVSWGLGSIIQSRNKIGMTPEVSSAWQQMSGAFGLTLFAILTHEPLPTPTNEAWIAWVYLVVFGSVIAFTSYVKALRLLPMGIVMTYAYVNPVIAIVLGWIILDEPITVYTISGTLLVVLGVMGIFREKKRIA